MIKRNIKSRFTHILWHSDLEATRFSLACGSLLWAVLLFWPGPLFSETRTTYLIMSKMAPELLWAAAFLLQGLVMIYSLLWGYKSHLSFIVDALLGCVLWTTSTFACFLAHYQSLATYQPPAAMSFEVIGAVMSWWCLVRYTIEKKIQ